MMVRALSKRGGKFRGKYHHNPERQKGKKKKPTSINTAQNQGENVKMGVMKKEKNSVKTFLSWIALLLDNVSSSLAKPCKISQLLRD